MKHIKKLFVSADIEGNAGITRWEETENGHPRYAYFQDQMSREVAAACRGALGAGCEEILVKDAHDSACNLIPRMLPEEVCLFRGWGSDPMSMMCGLDETFDGVFFTGYHSGVGMDCNPLSHTMNTQNTAVLINGEPASELMINSITAATLGVPVLLVTGDQGLCHWMKQQNPNVETVPVSRGVGRGSISIHPDKAIRLIQEAAGRALARSGEECMFPLPPYFQVEIAFREHARAKQGSHYPGCAQIAPTKVAFESDDWAEVLKFFDFVL